MQGLPNNPRINFIVLNRDQYHFVETISRMCPTITTTLRSNSGLPSIILQMLRGFRRRRTSTRTETTISKANGNDAQDAAAVVAKTRDSATRTVPSRLSGLAVAEVSREMSRPRFA